MDKEIEKKPWRDGNYKSIEGGSAVTIHGEKMTVDGTSFESTLSFGNFGEADPRISEITGEQYYNVESRIDIMGEEMVDFAVLVERGMKLVFKGRSGDRVRTLVWISEEEFNKDCDAIEAPWSHYKVEPERRGKLLWISGPPGVGKSTSAQLLSREHGFVYYEGDCFLNMRNPYIPPHVENPSLAQFQQRKLSGNGKAEREKVVEKVLAEYKAVMEGKAWDEEVMEEGAREMFKDIVRERARLGGDWVVAGILFTSKMRRIARAQLGEDLEIVMLEMTKEGQEQRVNARHEGNQVAMNMLRVFSDLVEPADVDEEQTRRIKVSAKMTPDQVVQQILGNETSSFEK